MKRAETNGIHWWSGHLHKFMTRQNKSNTLIFFLKRKSNSKIILVMYKFSFSQSLKTFATKNQRLNRAGCFKRNFLALYSFETAYGIILVKIFGSRNKSITFVKLKHNRGCQGVITQQNIGVKIGSIFLSKFSFQIWQLAKKGNIYSNIARGMQQFYRISGEEYLVYTVARTKTGKITFFYAGSYYHSVFLQIRSFKAPNTGIVTNHFKGSYGCAKRKIKQIYRHITCK